MDEYFGLTDNELLKRCYWSTDPVLQRLSMINHNFQIGLENHVRHFESEATEREQEFYETVDRERIMLFDEIKNIIRNSSDRELRHKLTRFLNSF